MLVRRHSQDYNFLGDPSTGLTMRWGRHTRDNPARAPWPELADIAISNQCSQGCQYCYRDSIPDGGLMSFEQYAFVLDRLHSPRWGKVFQVALGGGEPAQHPELARILGHTKECGVVANFTTSGVGLDQSLARLAKDCVGAVAVSAMSLEKLNRRAVALLCQAGVRVNIHYVLGRASLAQATDILLGKCEDFLSGVNAVIFLTLKPMGRAGTEHRLHDGPELKNFLSAIGNQRCQARIGFDACFVPLLLRHAQVNPEYVDACEAGFFSLFIDETLQAKPCSFALGQDSGLDLEHFDLDYIWNIAFEQYRTALGAPPCQEQCPVKHGCRGPCPFHPNIVPCPVRGTRR